MGDKVISVKRIREMCMYCMGGNRAMVARCESKRCPLVQYRMGKNPHRTGIGGNPNLRVEVSK